MVGEGDTSFRGRLDFRQGSTVLLRRENSLSCLGPAPTMLFARLELNKLMCSHSLSLDRGRSPHCPCSLVSPGLDSPGSPVCTNFADAELFRCQAVISNSRVQDPLWPTSLHQYLQ
jgi:hypothetical protein